MRKLKSTLFVVMAFFAVVAFAMGIAFMPKDSALAAVDTTAGFYVEDGAGVRFKKGERGIRWTGHMSKAYYDKISEDGTLDVVFGLAIAPQVDGQIDDDKESTYPYDGNIVFEKKLDAESKPYYADISFNVAIYYDDLLTDLGPAEKEDGSKLTEAEIKAYVYKAYTTSLFARPYYKVGDGEIQYGAYFDTGRSMQGIALYNYLNAEKIWGNTEPEVSQIKEILLGYINYGKNDTNGIKERDDVIIPNAGYYSYYDALKGKTVPTTLSIEGVELDATDKLYAGAKDITSALNVANGTVDYSNVVIEGVEAGTEGKLTLLKTNGDVYTIPYTYVTLALNEMSDFEYFRVQDTCPECIVAGTVTCPVCNNDSNAKKTCTNCSTKGIITCPTCNGSYSYFNWIDSKDDVEWDGYYILLNDINASGYKHTSYVKTWDLSNTQLKNIKANNKGLTGTFDGMGHTISNYKNWNNASVPGSSASCAGLFPVVNGGTVKNLGLTLVSGSYFQGGGFMGYFINGGILQDCIINFGTDITSMWHERLIAYVMESSCKITRCLVTWDSNRHREQGPYLPSPELWDCVTDSFFINKNGLDLHYNFPGESEKVVVTNPCTECVDAIDPECAVCNGTGVVTTEKALGAYTVITAGARFKDGVEQSGIDNKLYRRDDKRTVYTLAENETYRGQSSWTYKLVDGAKAYTNLTTMSADKKANSFANWSTDIWTIVDGVPYFKEDASVSFDGFAIDKETFVASEMDVYANDTITVYAASGSKVLDIDPTVTATSGAEFVTIAGNKVTFNTHSQTVVLNVTYGGETKALTVTVRKPIVEYTSVLQLSASEGILFEGSEVIELDKILSTLGFVDAGTPTVSTESGKAIALSDGLFTGYQTAKQKEYVEDAILLEYADSIVKLNVKVATLVIDEATDLKHFLADSNNWPYGKRCTSCETLNPSRNSSATEYCSNCSAQLPSVNYWATIFEKEDGLLWDGYYVLAKNIDATGYTHDHRNGKNFAYGQEPTRLDHLSSQGWSTGNVNIHGFTGVLDGQGYTISNLKTAVHSSQQADGLLGLLNNAIIQNIGFVNCDTYGRSGASYDHAYGFLAYGATKSTKFSNVYVSTPEVTPGAYYTPLVYGMGKTTYQVSNVVIIDNTIDAYTSGRYSSSFSSQFKIEEPSDSSLAFIYGSSKESNCSTNKPFGGMYIVSNKPIYGIGTGTAYTAIIDAKYVDGAAIDLSYTANAGTAVDVFDATVHGAYRYTSYDKFVKDAENRDFSNFASNMWTLVNGVPVFTSAAPLVNETIFKADDKEIVSGNVVELEVNSSLDIIADYDGQEFIPTLSTDSELVTIEGNTVFAGDTLGTVVVDVEYQFASTSVTLEIIHTVEEVDDKIYTFSAEDGLFFDGDTVVSFEEIMLAEGKEDYEILKIKDSLGYQLTNTDGAILGYKDLNKRALQDGAITIYADSFNLRIPVRAASLIIDEVDDLDYFQIKQDFTFEAPCFKAGDFEWDGYYMMVKDLDVDYNLRPLYADGVKYTKAGVETSKPIIRDIINLNYATNSLSNKGLTGTFDGNGHKITNIGKTNSSSLFGLISNGIVKNLGLYIPTVSYRCTACDDGFTSATCPTCKAAATKNHMAYGIFGSYLTNEAKIMDVYINSSYETTQWGEVLFFDDATTDSEVIRMVVYYDQARAVNGGVGGPFTYTNPARGLGIFKDSIFVLTRDIPLNWATAENRVYVQTTVTDCSVCAGVAGDTTCAECAGEGVVKTSKDVKYVDRTLQYSVDAKYVNGVERTSAETAYTTGLHCHKISGSGVATDQYVLHLNENFTYKGATSYTITLAEGIRRYHSLQALLADKENIPSKPWSTWDRNIWDFTTSGTPII